jgi:hypothetical protein
MRNSRRLFGNAVALWLSVIALGCTGCQKPGQSRADDQSLVKARLKTDEAQFRSVCDPEHISLPRERYAEEWKKLLDACAVAAHPMANKGNSAAQFFRGEQLERDERYEEARPWLEKLPVKAIPKR